VWVGEGWKGELGEMGKGVWVELAMLTGMSERHGATTPRLGVSLLWVNEWLRTIEDR